jgi:hypothetical protein
VRFKIDWYRTAGVVTCLAFMTATAAATIAVVWHGLGSLVMH